MLLPNASGRGRLRFSERLSHRAGVSLWAAALFLASLAFFALTWSGRYYNDSASLIESFERGELRFAHPAYLPIASLLHLLFAPFGASREFTLGALSVLSASGAVVLIARIAALGTSSRFQVLCGALAAVTAAVWISAGFVEIHALSLLCTCVAILVAYHAPTGLLIRMAAATVITLVGHRSTALLIPALAAIALAGARSRGERVRMVDVVGLFAVGGGMHLLVTWGSTVGNDGYKGFGAAVVLKPVLGLLAAPSYLAQRVFDELLRPYGVLVVLCAVGVFRRSGSPVLLRIAAGVAVAAMVPVALSAHAYEGQYLIPLTPFLVLGASMALASLGLQVGRIVLIAALLGQLALSIPEQRRFALDVDRQWASDVSALGLTRDSVVICRDYGRTRRIRTMTSCSALRLDLKPALEPKKYGAVVAAGIREKREAGRRVFLDPVFFDIEAPVIRKLFQVIQESVAFKHLGGVDLWEAVD